MSMPGLKRNFLLLAGLLSFTAGCMDDPVNPGGSPAAIPAPITPGSEGEPVFSLFTVEFGSVRTTAPGSVLELEARVRANASARNVRVRLVLPDAEAARMNVRTAGFRTLVNAPLRAQWEERLDLRAGEELQRFARVRVPAPGYYRAVLSAEGETPTPSVGARWVQPFASREVWLLVREEGVEVTEDFDARRVPQGMRAEPGPFRSVAERARTASSPSSRRGDASLTYTPRPEGDGQYQGYVWFYDDYYGTFKSVSGVQVDFSYYSYDNGSWIYAGSQSYITSADGNIYFHCNLDQTRQRVEVDVALWSEDVYVEGGFYHGVFSSCLEFGQDIGFEVPKHHARAFLNLRQTAAASYNVFGIRRYQLNVNVDAGSAGGGHYSTASDQLTLWNDAIWGPNGVRMTAHQYGHALHFKALGGYVSGSCPSSQPALNQSSDHHCAYAEGFAEFYAAALWGSSGSNFAAVRTPTITPGMDGSLIGGSIAAFLYDLYDSADDAGEAGSGRNFDSITLPGSYLATVMRTCRTTHLSGSSGQFPHTIDRLIACLENNANIYGPYFPGLHRVVAYSEQATEPATWSQPAIRSLWLHNLYGH
jgi:hypothetical protein